MRSTGGSPAAATADTLEVGGLSLRDLLDASPDGLLFATEDGRILVTNRRLEEMFGYGAGELIGRSVEVLVPAALRDRHTQHRADYHGDPHVRPMGLGRHLVGVCADGSEIAVEISLSPVVRAGGKGVIAAIRDDTERRGTRAATTRDAVAAEDVRIAFSLLDTIVAGLFKAGLTLQGTVDLCDGLARERVEQTIAAIDDIIREMRHVIFDIGGPTTSTSTTSDPRT